MRSKTILVPVYEECYVELMSVEWRCGDRYTILVGTRTTSSQFKLSNQETTKHVLNFVVGWSHMNTNSGKILFTDEALLQNMEL